MKNKALHKIKANREKAVLKAMKPRQQHFDAVAKGFGFENSDEAYKVMGKKFIEKARINAPHIMIH